MAKKKVFSIGRSLSDGLEQTIAAAQNYSSDLRVDVIPLNKIETDPENPRSVSITLTDILTEISANDPFHKVKVEEREALQSLANSILDQGIINPILVYEHNGMYRLIAGERRTLASALAGKSDIQAKIIDGKPNELKIRVLQWIENIERSDLSLSDRLDNLDKIVNAFAKENHVSPQEVTITQISKLIGCVKAHAINLKAVLNADENIKSLIALNKIGSLEKASILTSINNPDLKKKAIERCVNGATLKELKSILNNEKSMLKPINRYKQVYSDVGLVNFGHTHNIQVAKVILDSVIRNGDTNLTPDTFANIDFNNHVAVSNAFKQLITTLEQIHE